MRRLFRLFIVVSFSLQTLIGRWIAYFLVPAVISFSVRLAYAKLFMNQDQALAKAFPESTRIERKTHYLTPEEVRSIEQSTRTKIESTIVVYYLGFRDKDLMGTAFFDTRIVRTMPMTFMAFVKADGTMGSVDVLSFHEPEDYLPRAGWFRLFQNRPTNEGLRLRRNISNVAGATLTCQAVTDGVRQIQALHQLLQTSSRESSPR